jgi:hypothetical protein
MLATPHSYAEQREFVTRGEVLSVSVEKATLTMKEIAEPAENSRPGTMQSGVVRSFTVSADNLSLSLAKLQAGIHTGVAGVPSDEISINIFAIVP